MQDIISEITSHRRWVGVLQCKGLVSRDAPGQSMSGKVARFVAGSMTSEATLVAMVTVTRRGAAGVAPDLVEGPQIETGLDVRDPAVQTRSYRRSGRPI